MAHLANDRAAGLDGQTLPRRPLLTFWLVAVALELLVGITFIVSGAEEAIDEGLQRAGVEFGSDLITAARVVIAYPAAILGVGLALGQVAAQDLAVWLSSRRQDGSRIATAALARIRPWSAEVGWRGDVPRRRCGS